jgi:CPA1 family monovalent cation:H+ antiporter
MNTCEHLKDLTAKDFPPPGTPEGCEECLATGTRWVQLRECAACGHVGCCDSSPGKHATGHFKKTRHPVIRSFQPGEDWTWCYVDEVQGELQPAGQTVGSRRS